MIYIGKCKGNPIYHEVLFVAKTCNSLQNTEDYCPNCGTKMKDE